MSKKKSAIWKRYLKAAMIPVLFLVIWEIAGERGSINVSILSMPSKILNGWIKLWQDGKYQTYLVVSTIRFVKGFVAGSVAGLLLGTVMGLSKRITAYLGATTSLLRSIPLIAWVPIMILSLGVGEATRVILVAIGCFWSVFLNAMDGIKSVDLRYIEVADVLEKKSVETVVKVVIPAAFPSIVTGLRSGFSNAWRSIVAAEMIGTSSGIGFIISYGREINRPDFMYVGLVTVAIIGLLIDTVLVYVQNKMLSRYYGKA